MPSTPAYDLVKDDADLRVPLHAEQAFFHGISFQAKLIGWREVPRPTCRSEIVQAMRRIRFECKAQNNKKQKVTIQISLEGIKVLLKKKKRKKKTQWPNTDDDLEIMKHPIYRIFYVSHDNSDLKIFSYIARDGSTDTFKCSVFKSNKKSQAMRIVRTVGQAFEVCHKFNLQKNSLDVEQDDYEEEGENVDSLCEMSDRCSEQHPSDDEDAKNAVTPDPLPMKRPNHLDISPNNNYSSRKSPMQGPFNMRDDASTSAIDQREMQINTSKEMQLMRESLEEQTIQTRQALAQLVMLRDQLITETNARMEAQARTQQLLQQNRELLEHLAQFGGFHETEQPGLSAAAINLAPQLSSSAKVAAWFQQLNVASGASLPRPESGFVSGDSRSDRHHEDPHREMALRQGGYSGHSVSAARAVGDLANNASQSNVQHDLCDEYFLVEGSANLWRKLSSKRRRKLLSLRLGKVTTF